MARILVVDDDADFTDSVKSLLESRGHQVTVAGSGSAGLELARSGHPEVMILDVMMEHDSEGFEVVQALKADTAVNRIPVILLTGIRKAKNLPFAFEPDPDWLPVSAVLEKPASPEALFQAVDHALMTKPV